jgi:lysine 2,3-aminomutase
VAKGIEIMEALRGNTSGYAIPTYVIDAPEGGGKVPILPNYLLSMSDSRVVVRNYEGFITTYAQPTDYQPHNPATCAYCQARRSEGGQEGVAGLLAGGALTIAPERWHTLHQRGADPQPLLFEAIVSPVGNNGHQSELQIPVLLNTEGKR